MIKPDDLTKADATSKLAKRLEPKVVSLAEPEKDWLLQARADLNSDPALQKILYEGRTGDPKKVVSLLAVKLNAKWGGDYWFESQDVAQYLLDEFLQLGEGVHLVSKETGKVYVTLDENDIYQPNLVPREGGGMAQPMKQIRPDIASLLTTWSFERSREEKLVEALAARGHQTDLLKEDGDPRLLVASRAGRKRMVAALATFEPKALLEVCGGTSGAFLRHFDLQTSDPEDTAGLTLVEGVVASNSKLGIHDISTTNLQFNVASSLRGTLVQGWVREMARLLSFEAPKAQKGQTVLAAELTKEHLGDTPLWVAPPDRLRQLKRLEPKVLVMPVENAQLLGVRDNAGVVVVPTEFHLSSHELFDRWETHASLKIRLWVNWKAFQPVTLQDEAFEGLVL